MKFFRPGKLVWQNVTPFYFVITKSPSEIKSGWWREGGKEEGEHPQKATPYFPLHHYIRA